MNTRVKAFKEQTASRNKKYLDFVAKFSPLQNTARSLLKAFAIGGTICILGQVITDVAPMIFEGMDKDTAGTVASVALIAITCLLTGIGVFDKIALQGGGGTFLPITGFANSISSAAMEYKAEGYIFGLAAKFFSLAGAVVVNSVFASFVVGVIYWILGMLGVAV